MKQRILTPKEKTLLIDFLNDGKSSTIIRMLRYRTKKYLPTIKDEISLLERLL